MHAYRSEVATSRRGSVCAFGDTGALNTGRDSLDQHNNSMLMNVQVNQLTSELDSAAQLNKTTDTDMKLGSARIYNTFESNMSPNKFSGGASLNWKTQGVPILTRRRQGRMASQNLNLSIEDVFKPKLQKPVKLKPAALFGSRKHTQTGNPWSPRSGRQSIFNATGNIVSGVQALSPIGKQRLNTPAFKKSHIGVGPLSPQRK